MSTPKENKKWAKPLGILVILLAIVGIVFIIITIINSISAKATASKKAEMQKFQKMLVPVVMNDIDDFDDITKANMSQLIEASVWAIIKSDVTTDQYEVEDGLILYPAADVEAKFISLFGAEREIEHQTVSSAAFEFVYDEEKGVYKAPITGVDPTYTPKVLDITEKSNTVILTVAYLSGSGFEQAENGDIVEPTPSKYVKVTLREKGKAYYISAIQPTSAPETLGK
ncbi:MAG: hypothetical protein MJ115_04865 [Clostridia bacterium]|nr:hypothetical protein [Clostridia bacterium]